MTQGVAALFTLYFPFFVARNVNKLGCNFPPRGCISCCRCTAAAALPSLGQAEQVTDRGNVEGPGGVHSSL